LVWGAISAINGRECFGGLGWLALWIAQRERPYSSTRALSTYYLSVGLVFNTGSHCSNDDLLPHYVGKSRNMDVPDKRALYFLPVGSTLTVY
jgi:hypothetical protein